MSLKIALSTYDVNNYFLSYSIHIYRVIQAILKLFNITKAFFYVVKCIWE